MTDILTGPGVRVAHGRMRIAVLRLGWQGLTSYGTALATDPGELAACAPLLADAVPYDLRRVLDALRGAGPGRGPAPAPAAGPRRASARPDRALPGRRRRGGTAAQRTGASRLAGAQAEADAGGRRQSRGSAALGVRRPDLGRRQRFLEPAARRGGGAHAGRVRRGAAGAARCPGRPGGPGPCAPARAGARRRRRGLRAARRRAAAARPGVGGEHQADQVRRPWPRPWA